MRERLARAAVLAGCAAGALAGCRSDGTESRRAQPPPATTTATAMTPATSDSLELELAVPTRVHVGEPVPFTLRVQNRTQRPLDLYLRGRAATFDVVVSRPGGEVLWRRLEDEIIPAIVNLRTLAPGERLELEGVWDQRTRVGEALEPGEYTARGLLLTEGNPLETPAASFQVLEPQP